MTSKAKGRSYRYKDYYEEIPIFKDWLVRNKDPSKARCKWCNISMLAERTIMREHTLSHQHLKNMKSHKAKVKVEGNIRCRTCLIVCSKNSSKSMSSIDSNTNCSYSATLTAVTGLKVLNSDVICFECQVKLVDAYKFRRTALKADKWLYKRNCRAAEKAEVKTEVVYDDDYFDNNTVEFSDTDEKPLALINEPHKVQIDVKDEVKAETKVIANQCGVCKKTFGDIMMLLQHARIDHNQTLDRNQIKSCKKEIPAKELSRGDNGNNEPVKKKRRAVFSNCNIPVKSMEGMEVNVVRYTQDRKWKDIKPRNKLKKKLRENNVMIKRVKLKKDIKTEKVKTTAVQKNKNKTTKEVKVYKYKMPQQHRCNVCYSMFSTMEAFNEHSREHGNTDVIMCALCDRVYLTYPQFKRHFNTHHPELEDVISIENTKSVLELEDPVVIEKVWQHSRLTTIGDLISACVESMEGVTEIEVYVETCGLCGAVLISEEQVKVHKAAEHPDIDTWCCYCAKCYHSKERSNLFSNHLEYCKTLALKEECLYCGRRTLDIHMMRIHVEECHKEMLDAWLKRYYNFVCDRCGIIVYSKQKIQTHLRFCEPDGDYQCSECNKKFTKKYCLNMHFKRMHTSRVVVKSYLCQKCGMMFERKGQLERHYHIHTGERPYKCRFCPQGYRATDQLAYHERKHTGETPFICSFCNKKFARPKCYSRHVMIHTGERPFKCNICEAGFIQKQCLTAHMRKHTNMEPGLPLDKKPYDDGVLNYYKNHAEETEFD